MRGNDKWTRAVPAPADVTIPIVYTGTNLEEQDDKIGSLQLPVATRVWGVPIYSTKEREPPLDKLNYLGLSLDEKPGRGRDGSLGSCRKLNHDAGVGRNSFSSLTWWQDVTALFDGGEKDANNYRSQPFLPKHQTPCRTKSPVRQSPPRQIFRVQPE